MSRAFALALLFMALPHSQAPASDSAGTDWPRWRGANYDGASMQKNVFKESFALKLVWKRKLGSGYSAISIANGHAVTMFSDGEYDYVISLDPDSGNEQWRYRIATTYPGRDGANPGPVSTPAIADEMAFALGPKGQLLALDLKTGKPLWSTHLIETHQAVPPHWGFTTSPLVYNDLLIVETGGGRNNAVTAFNKVSGKVVWSAQQDTVDYQSPLLATIAGRAQLLWAGQKYLFGFEPDTGKELWHFRHGGDGFYQRIVNPVVVAENKLLLTNAGAQAKLIQIKQNDAGFEVAEIWKTPHLKRNYNIPIYHEGYVYGYSGDFLTCVDADSGKLAWKSRPPGNGFTILVDGHLVIMTKRGALHVAKASPKDYVEVASLPLFDKLAWSPPSFANGKIYVRNSFDEIACVAAVSRDLAAAGNSPLPQGMVFPESAFGKFLKRAESASDKKALVEKFVQSQSRFPVIEGDSLVHIVYWGEARDLVLRGDMFEDGEERPLHRLRGTDFYYASFKLEPEARVCYQFIKDLEQRMADPHNPEKINWTLFPGEASEIYMPRADRPRHFLEPPAGPRGRLDTLTFVSEKIRISHRIWGGERRIQVYLPPGYDDATTKRYPVIYVNDGDNALASGQMKNTLDNLVGKTVQPVIAVFIQSRSPYEFARLERKTYAQMVAEKLVPFIDAKYRTIATPEARALMGGDEGGYAAVYTGFHHSAVFGKIAGQSVLAIADGGPELLALAQKSPRLPLQLYLDWGKYDYRYSSYAYDVRKFSRDLVEILQGKKYQIAGGEANEGADFRELAQKNGQDFAGVFSTPAPG